MLLTYYTWIKAVKSGSIMWASLCALAYFYMVSSWGGYVFLINLIPLHVLALMLSGEFFEMQRRESPRSLHAPRLHRLLHRLRDRHDSVHADLVRRLPADRDQRAHGREFRTLAF